MDHVPVGVEPSGRTARTVGRSAVARKTSVPSEHVERLKELYSQQREALMAFAAANDAVCAAEAAIVAAQQALKEARGGADAAYQTLVELMGSATAAKLTGRRRNRARASSAESPQQDRDLPEATGAVAPAANSQGG